MIRPTVVVVVLCFATHSAPAAPRVMADQDGERLDAEILVLQKSRIETLERTVEILLRYYRSGIVDLSRVLAAQIELTDAGLEMSKTADERIDVLKKQLKIAESSEEFATTKFQAGVTTEVDVQQAKAARLDIQIKLLQEQKKKLAERPKKP